MNILLCWMSDLGVTTDEYWRANMVRICKVWLDLLGFSLIWLRFGQVKYGLV